MQKIKKRKDENPHAVIKPFNLSYRKFSQPSVINLPKEEVLTRFVQAEKKARAVRVVEADEQMEQSEQTVRSDEQTSRANAKEKKRKEKKKRDRERRKKKRESARRLNPTQPPPRRDENSPNKRVHFFAEFSRFEWCRKMKVVEENAPVNFGIRLCDSKKVLDQILENNCEKVVQTRLRYNPKTKEHFIDAVIKVPKVSEDKEGEIIVGGTDVGNEPFCTFYSGSTGECFNEIILGKDDEKINGSKVLLFSKKEKRKKSYRVGGAVGKNVVDRAQQNSNGTEARESENAQAVVSGEAKLEEEIGESARQFAELQKEVFFHAREKSV